MAERVIQTSFSSGELSPKLYARVDLEKYGSGAALMRNMFTDYRGGASNRAGTKFIGRAKSNATGDARLIPFIFSTDQAYILEVGNDYIRFIANGAYLAEATTAISAITQANPAVVTDTAHGYTTGDEIEIASVGGMTELNGKNFLVVVIDANSYSLQDLNGNAIDSTAFTAYTSGGTAARVYTLVSPYSTADLPLLKYAQDADTLTFVHPSHPPYDLTRTSSTTFTLTQVTFGPSLAGSSPITVTTVNEANDHSAYSYTVTAVDSKGEEGTVPFPAFIATAILNQTTNTFNTVKWAPVTGAVSYRVYKAGPWASILNGSGKATPPSITYGFIGTANGTSFIDVNIAPDYSQSPPTFSDPVTPGQIATFNVTAGGTGYNTSDWLVFITATGGGGAGFQAYGLINPNNGSIESVWMVNPGAGFTTLPTFSDDGANTATYAATLGPLTGTYPAAVGYHQQRRFYGGTNNFPEAFFASQTGFYNNFDTNTILLDSDAISASIASRQVNAIKSFTTMPTGLVVLTTGGGFLVSGGGAQAAITPTNIVALQQPSSGCNDLPPLVVNQDILYCQNRGFVVRDLAFSFYTQSYLGTDRSVLASHLFENFLPVDWTYAEQPYRQVLTVRNDGHILAFTYVPEQEMFAWSQYDTQGLFLSITSIPEGEQNAVYVLVKRHVVNPLGGECWVNYVERFDPRLFDCILEAWFLDCALEYPRPAPDATIYLSGSTGTVNVFGYDPCTGQPGGSGPFSTGTLGYTITAEENYDPATLLTFSEDEWNWPFTAQCYVGLSYYKAGRSLIYSTSLTPVANIQTNDTGFDLWSGQSLIVSGATYNANQIRFRYVLSKNIDTQVVTRGDTYDPTSSIPVGVQFGFSGTIAGGSGYTDALYGAVVFTGGSGTLAFGTVRVSGGVVTSVSIRGAPSGYEVGDVITAVNAYLGGAGSGFTYTITAIDFVANGTERRYVEMDNTIHEWPFMIDPWTGNAWQHAVMDIGDDVCSVYMFPSNKSYGQQISPYFGAHDGSHLQLLGFTENYTYVYEDSNSIGDLISATPRVPGSVEITADYMLPYFWFTSPWQGHRLYSAAFATTGHIYIYGCNDDGSTRSFKLYRITEPSAAGLFNATTVGGSLTDISTWTSSNGPNTGGALYTTDDSLEETNILQPFYMPDDNIVCLITKYFPQDIPASAGTQSDLFFHATYVTSPDGSPGFEQHSKFITGFLDASLGPLASTGNTAPVGAAWAVIDCQQLNLYLNNSTFSYTGIDYSKCWFALKVAPVSATDTFAPPTTPYAVDDSYVVLHVEYQFRTGFSPSVVQFYTEDGWDTQLVANSDYTGLMTNPNKLASLMATGYVSQATSVINDVGLYDEVNDQFWWSGQTANMIDVSQPFYDRHFGTPFHPMPPLLRLGFTSSGGETGSVLQINCGKILITESTSSWELTGTVTSPLAIAVPDDPTGLTLPIAPGSWTLTTPVTEVTGLDYLEGKIVWALADGTVVGPLTVSGGAVTLSTAATNIIVGLLYQSQLQTLEIDAGSPTIQGKRKQIPATTARLNLTAGLKAGRTFTGVVPMKECAPTTVPSLFSGDARTIVNAAWDKPGQVCYQQDLPLPVTILGVIPEVVVGDTGK